MYKIPPAEKSNREERDKKQTQLYVEHFGSNYCPLTIDRLDGETIKKYILNNSGRILLHAPTGSGKLMVYSMVSQIITRMVIVKWDYNYCNA